MTREDLYVYRVCCTRSTLVSYQKTLVKKHLVMEHSHGKSLKNSEQGLRKNVLWPNLKNLSGGLNLSPGLNMVGST